MLAVLFIPFYTSRIRRLSTQMKVFLEEVTSLNGELLEERDAKLLLLEEGKIIKILKRRDGKVFSRQHELTTGVRMARLGRPNQVWVCSPQSFLSVLTWTQKGVVTTQFDQEVTHQVAVMRYDAVRHGMWVLYENNVLGLCKCDPPFVGFSIYFELPKRMQINDFRVVPGPAALLDLFKHTSLTVVDVIMCGVNPKREFI